MNNEHVKIGTIDGCPIYAETGLDQVRILIQKAKKDLANRRTLKDGDRFMVSLVFDSKELIAEISIKEFKLEQ